MGIRAIATEFAFSEMNNILAHFGFPLHLNLLVEFLSLLSVGKDFLLLLPSGLAIVIIISESFWIFVQSSFFEMVTILVIWLGLSCDRTIINRFLVNFFHLKSIRLVLRDKWIEAHFQWSEFFFSNGDNVLRSLHFSWSSSASEWVIVPAGMLVITVNRPRVHWITNWGDIWLRILLRWVENLVLVHWVLHHLAHCNLLNFGFWKLCSCVYCVSFRFVENFYFDKKLWLISL